MPRKDPRIDKRKVTLTNYIVIPVDGAEPEVHKHKVEDFVGPEYLEEYLRVARTPDPKTGAPRWQQIEVSEEPDAGPGGYHGETSIPAELNHPLAGTVLAATEEEK